MQYDHKTLIFIVSHNDPDFTGPYSGVDFSNGRGSTSSLRDAAALMELGCMIEDGEARVKAEAYAAGNRAEQAKSAADQKLLAAVENLPLSEWSKSRQEHLDNKAQEAKRTARRSARYRHAHNLGR